MDINSGNLFQTNDILLNQSENDDEEDIEEFKRRNEELKKLLNTELEDFKFDENTVNSSAISAVSCDNAENKYLEADGELEQLRVLYEVRLRELQALRDEYKQQTDQMGSIKKKLMLSEAELEQLKVSFRNNDNLLVEKTSAVRELTSVLETKEKQIQEYLKIIDNMNIEISSYKTTLNDLHLQLQYDKNPFDKSNKQFTLEEYKSSYQEQITKLEIQLEEKSKTTKQQEKEIITLKEELNKLIDANNEGTNLIKALTNNFEAAQKQCEELINVIETLTNENRHLRERITNTYQNISETENSLDSSKLIHQVDKLKRMLVDKSVQINTLTVKLRNYEENLKELLEYRKLKSDVYQKEFEQCDNEEHTKNLLLMQNDLQNYRRIIEDKNQQILHLNGTNKDLLAKMEETLSQTRNDIKSFSNKYSLPQLEKMAEDLKYSQNRILCLEQKLQTSEEQRLLLEQKENNTEQEFKKELEKLKLTTDKERNNVENEIKKLKHELFASSAEIENLKRYIEQLMAENVQLKSCTKTMEDEDSSLKTQYLDCAKALYEAQNKVQLLQHTVDELTNLKNSALSEKCTYESGLKELENKLYDSKKCMTKLETELVNSLKELKIKEERIQELQTTVSDLKQQLNLETNINIELELANKEKIIETLREKISELEEFQQAQISKNNKELNECLKCKLNHQDKKEETEVEIKEMTDTQNADANLKENQIQNFEEVKVSLEIKLREEIQEEYSMKLKDVENRYEKVYASSKALCAEQINKLKSQESTFREHLAMILKECTKKIEEYENNRRELLEHIKNLQGQFHQHIIESKKKQYALNRMVEDSHLNSKRDAEKWKQWSQKLINSCLKIEATNKNSRDNILLKMKTYDSEIAVVEKSYDKIKKIVIGNLK